MTPRWTPIVEYGNNNGPLSGERLKYWRAMRALNKPNAQIRRVLAPCGRRSLKSELPKRALVRALGDITRDQPSLYVAAGPTREQIKRIAWQDLKKLVPTNWVKRIYETDLCIVTHWEDELQCIGLDRPQRIEGRPLNGIWMTERADIPAGAYDANIRPALADRRGWSIEEGTPDFDGPSAKEYEDAYNKAISGEDESSIAFTWSSESVLPREEIESMRNTLDDLYYQQEVGGLFVRLPDMAYYGFSLDKENGNVADVEFEQGKPLMVGCDFNFGFHKWALFQLGNEIKGIPEINVFDLVEMRNAEVGDMCALLKDKMLKLGIQDSQVNFFGDYSGNQRKAEATASAWKQIKNNFNYGSPQGATFYIREQPPIADRLRVVNSLIKSSDGTRRMKVHPDRCAALINDFRYVTRNQLFTQTNKGGELTQASDALGYAVRQLDKMNRWFET